MAGTYRHRPLKFLPSKERTRIRWNGELVTEEVPQAPWHERSKHLRAVSEKNDVTRERNRRVRHDRGFVDDWDDYVPPNDKTAYWD